MCEFMTLRVQFAQRMSPEVAALKITPPQSEGGIQCQSDITLEKAALGMPYTRLCSLLPLELLKYSETSSKKACPTTSMGPLFSIITTSQNTRTMSCTNSSIITTSQNARTMSCTNISTKISSKAFLSHSEDSLHSQGLKQAWRRHTATHAAWQVLTPGVNSVLPGYQGTIILVLKREI